MAQMNDRALHVCQNCKNRKKACDKLLPRCSYCAKRELECSYRLEPPMGADAVATASIREISRHFSRLATADWHDAETDGHLDIQTATSVHGRLRTRMVRWLEATGKPMPAIRDLFVGGVYRWLPIIAPWQLADAEMDIAGTTLSVDSLMLLLTMSLCVVACPRGVEASNDWRYHNRYLGVKEMFALSHSTMSPTMTLLQAALLIAVYEFAGRQPQIAYQTMQTCRGLYDVLAVGRLRTKDAAGLTHSVEALHVLQECMLARGFIILERLILLETVDQLGTSLTAFSCTSCRLSSFFDRQPDVESEILQGFYLEPTMAAAMQSFTGDGFPAMATAVTILGKVIDKIQSPDPTSSKVQELRRLDAELQDFLTEAMRGYRRPGHHCGAIAVGIRTLFLLHQYALELEKCCTIFSTDDRTASVSALDSAARMMAAVAESHMEDVDNIDMLPLTAAYNVKIAINHINRHTQPGIEWLESDLEALHAMEDAFRGRWRWIEA